MANDKGVCIGVEELFDIFLLVKRLLILVLGDVEDGVFEVDLRS